MELINKHLEHLAKISPYPISFSGDVRTHLNKWLVKSEVMESAEHEGTEPLLNTDCELVMDHEKSFMERERLLTNWQYYPALELREISDICHGRNYMEAPFQEAGDRRIYGLSVIYCKGERDVMVNVNTALQTPIRIWVNGQIAYISNYNYLFKNSFFVFKAKPGANTVLVERLLFSGVEGFTLPWRNFILNVRPCDQLRQYAEDPDFPFIDPALIDRLKQGYRIVPDKAIYNSEASIGLVVLREYLEFAVEDEIEVSLYDRLDKKVATIRTQSGKKIHLNPDPSLTGPMKITVRNCSTEEKKANDVFVLRGSFSEERDQLIQLAQEKLDNNGPMVETIQSLHALVDEQENRMNGTGEIIPENVWNNIFEKYHNFSVALSDLEKVNSDVGFPDSVIGRKMVFFKQENIDEGSTPYTVCLPEQYDKNRAYPLVLNMFYGFGIGKYSPDPRYSRENNFSDAILINLCGRGGLNQDYINEMAILEMIQETINRFSVDRDRIYLVGVCTGALKAFGMASRIPELYAGILSVTGTARLDIKEPDYGYLENMSNLMVYQLSNIEDYVYNFARVKDTADRFKQLTSWDFCDLLHEEIEDYMNASPKMMNRLLELKKDKYPKDIHFLTSEPIFNKSYWVTVDRIVDLSKKALVKAGIRSERRIEMDLENINQLGLLINRQEMGLVEQITLSINNREEIVELSDYTELNIRIDQDGSLHITSRVSDQNNFLELYNRITPDRDRLGIRDIYANRCQIVKPALSRSKKSFSMRLNRLLRMPLKERNRNYSYKTVKEGNLSPEILKESNFIYFVDVSELNDFRKEILDKFEVEYENDSLLYQNQRFSGSWFAMIKKENPFDPKKKALLMLANGEEAESALTDFMDTFDNNSLFYSDAVIYSEGTLLSFRAE